MNLNFIKFFKKKSNFFLFLVFVLIIINLFVRLNFALKLSWINDDSRDFLVTRNIIFDNDFRWIVPYAAWGDNLLKNSVFYYYFLSIFVFFSLANPLFYRLLFLLFFFIVLLIYSHLFSKLFFLDKKLRFLTVLLFLYYPSFYLCGSRTFQPNFAIPILISSTYYFFYSYKNKSIKYLSIAVLLYSITSNIHYANLMLLPWVFLFTVYFQYKFFTKRKNNFKLKTLFLSQLNYPSLILIINLIFLLLNQNLHVNFNSEKHSLLLFFKNLLAYDKSSFIDFYSNLKLFFASWMGTNFLPNLFYLIFITLILIFFFLKERRIFSIFSFLGILSFLPMFFFMNEVTHETWYFYPIYVFVFIFFISVVSSLNYKLAFIFLSFLLLSFIGEIYPISKKFLFEKAFNKHQFVANVISENLGITGRITTDFFIMTINYCNNDENSAYWLYIEQAINKKLLKNDPVGNSYFLYSSIYDYSNKVYLICDDSQVKHNNSRESWCFEEAGLKNLLKNYELLYSSDEKNLSIYYLFLIKPIHKYDYGMGWQLI